MRKTRHPNRWRVFLCGKKQKIDVCGEGNSIPMQRIIKIEEPFMPFSLFSVVQQHEWRCQNHAALRESGHLAGRTWKQIVPGSSAEGKYAESNKNRCFPIFIPCEILNHTHNNKQNRIFRAQRTFQKAVDQIFAKKAHFQVKAEPAKIDMVKKPVCEIHKTSCEHSRNCQNAALSVMLPDRGNDLLYQRNVQRNIEKGKEDIALDEHPNGIAEQEIGDSGKQADANGSEIQPQKKTFSAPGMPDTFRYGEKEKRCGDPAKDPKRCIVCGKKRYFEPIRGQMVKGHEKHGDHFDLIGCKPRGKGILYRV
ncbi:MAG: hypothetical protein Q4D50_03085 [Eubacteriales bacterium]|nr:hypothetical protein [Eubacteriales bacterium]